MKLKIKDNTKLNEDWLCEPNHIFAFGEAESEENDKSQKVTMDIDCLLDGLNALKTLGFKYVTLRVQNDFPMLVTDDTNNGNKLKGMFIAPRIYD